MRNSKYESSKYERSSKYELRTEAVAPVETLEQEDFGSTP
jgi:hypothetical protein